jgi:carboxymethylenebutenolidase
MDHTPADPVLHPISRTVSPERVIDEFIFEFTHDSEVPWILPGIAPTGRIVRIPILDHNGARHPLGGRRHEPWGVRLPGSIAAS